MHKPAKAWLEAALDPFHDYRLQQMSGFPDIYSGPSVVQVITKNVDISAPAGTVSNWDCNVFYHGITGNHMPHLRFGPYDFAVGYKKSAIDDLNLGNPVTGYDTIAPFTVESKLSTTADFTFGSTQEKLTDVDSADPYRVIGVGFEVHNTTATVNKQGQVTIGMLPPWSDQDHNTFAVDEDQGLKDMSHQCSQLGTIPENIADLRQNPSARTWDAKSGCYCVPTLLRIQEPRTNTARRALQYARGSTFFTTVPTDYGTVVTTPVPAMRANTVSGFSPMMAMFTGLSPETTMTLTVKTIIESFPQSGSALLPLASPGCPLDMPALSAYSAVSQNRPYAVKVSENASGDFFRKVIEAAEFASPLVGMGIDLIAPGYGRYASSGVDAATSLARKIVKKVDKGKKETRQLDNRNQAQVKPAPSMAVRQGRARARIAQRR